MIGDEELLVLAFAKASAHRLAHRLYVVSLASESGGCRLRASRRADQHFVLVEEAHPLVICVSFGAALCVIIDLRGAWAAHAIAHLQRDQASRLDVVGEARPLRVRVLEARHVAHVGRGTGTHASHRGIAH